MARTKKVIEEEEKIPDEVYKDKKYYYNEIYTCPLCREEFKFTTENKYIAKDAFVCSWKCFINYVKEQPSKNDAKRKAKEPAKQMDLSFLSKSS